MMNYVGIFVLVIMYHEYSSVSIVKFILGEIIMELKDALRRFRKYAKITQRQAAKAANTSERMYQEYEYGKAVPALSYMISLADYYDVSLDYLVGRSEDPARH